MLPIAVWCAESLEMADSAHDIRPKGHGLSEQSAPVNPSKQLQTLHGRVHIPFEEHWLGHGVYSEANED